MPPDRGAAPSARPNAPVPLVLALLVGLLTATPARVDAQLAAREAATEPSAPAPYADPPRFIPWVRARIAAEPARVELRLAAARELTAMGVIDSTHALRLAWLEQAEAEARAAVALDSTDADAHYWLAASLGLQADEQGGLAKISAARGAYAETLAALRLDPAHPGARHILGRLHAGALRLSRVNRLIARGLGLGPILSSASWESAEQNLRAAATGDPDRWVHELELAKLLVRRGRREEGAALLEDLARRSPRGPLDRHYQVEAIALLRAAD